METLSENIELIIGILTALSVMAGLIKKLIDTSKALNATTDVIEKCDILGSAAKDIKLELDSIEKAMPKGMKKQFGKAVDKARDKWIDFKVRTKAKREGKWRVK